MLCNVRVSVTAIAFTVVSILAFAPSAADEGAKPRRLRPFSTLPPHISPQITFWGLHDHHFEPGGFQPVIDLFAERSPFRLLNTTLRLQDHPLSDPAVHDHLAQLVHYARNQGFDPTLDLCLRLDRKPFQSAHPHDLQEMVKLAEVQLLPNSEAECTIKPESLGDHMTFYDTPYVSVAGRLLRVFSYERDGEILPQSIRDITADCRILNANATEVRVAVPARKRKETTACVMACFTHLSPDVFSPHLLEYQRKLVRQYADLPLAGAFKDEWGFPRTTNALVQHRAFWYSEPYAGAYAHATGGRDLIADLLLMAFDQRGRRSERQRAVNHFMRLNLLRNTEIERDFYDAVKETFGPNAFVGKHPTWYPRICPQEYTKNGLHWWSARRDIAQTDEVTPVFACTALAKKCGSAVWYNEFYSKSMEEYHRNIWRYALAGGRQIYHPPIPAGGFGSSRDRKSALERYGRLVTPEIMQSDCKIRMLNFISKAPIDSPVAVVFGHTSLMNWAGPCYDRSGEDVATKVWKDGFPVDMIPTSEIANGSLTVASDGAIQYGPQRYRAVVLVHPQFETPATAKFFSQVNPQQTMLLRLGAWTQDFDAEPIEGNSLLPAHMLEVADTEAAVARIVEHLRSSRVPPQAPLTSNAMWGSHAQALPGMAGRCRLIDGTWIQIAAEKNLLGDHLKGPLQFDGNTVDVDTIGLLAVRFDKDGKLEALAASGLKSLHGGGLSVELENRIDLALWQDDTDAWHGALQDAPDTLPPSLTEITDDLQLLTTGNVQ